MEEEKRKSSVRSLGGVKFRLAKLKWKKSGEGDGKPSGSVFSQQELKYWQPILVPRAVLPLYFIFGITFISLGVLIYFASTEFPEIVLDYTQCDLLANENYTRHGEEHNSYWKYDNATSVCTLKFDVPVDLDEKVLLMYQITNLFQNYRRYVASISSKQLLGEAVPISLLADCVPLINSTKGGIPAAFYPCGLIANSMFNDTFTNLTSESGETFEFSERGIAWETELKKYKKTTYQPNSQGIYTDIIPPPDWGAYNGTYTIDNIPDLSQDEHFMVWMRCASSPNFRKLYGQTNSTLKAGTWEIQVKSQYVVRQFKGTKSLVIHRETWLGGHASNLGFSYLSIGTIMILVGLFLLAWHSLRPRRLGDASLLSWNSEPKPR